MSDDGSDTEFDPPTTMKAMKDSVAAVEASLEEIWSKSWTETVSGLEGLDRAKMDVLIAYTINDLIWVYLRMKGVDPSTHEVSPELDRIAKYYTKIRHTENPPVRSMTLDTAAAKRFVTHAIPLAQRLPANSAAGIAAQQAKAAFEEQEQAQESRRATRWKFVAGDAEKLLPGKEDDGGEDADELLGDIQREIAGEAMSRQSSGSGSDGVKGKRKRAEDLG